MNDEFYQDDNYITFRPSSFKKKKPRITHEYGYFSPHLLNRKLIPTEREGYYKYFFMANENGKAQKKYAEVSLEQWQALTEGDREDHNVFRREEERKEYDVPVEGSKDEVNVLDTMLGWGDGFDHEKFWVDTLDVQRTVSKFFDVDKTIFYLWHDKDMPQKEIAKAIGRNEPFVTRRIKAIVRALEHDRYDDGERSPEEIKELLSYNEYMRSGEEENFVDVFVYDFLTSIPQELVMKYLFVLHGQFALFRYCFRYLWFYNRGACKDVNTNEFSRRLSMPSFQLYKKYIRTLPHCHRCLFVELELEVERRVKTFGVKDKSGNKKFLQSVQKLAIKQGLSVEEYRDKMLFPVQWDRIKKRVEKFLKQHPEVRQASFKSKHKRHPEGLHKSSSATATFVANKK